MPAGPLKAVKAAYLEDGEGDSDDVRDSLRYVGRLDRWRSVVSEEIILVCR